VSEGDWVQAERTDSPTELRFWVISDAGGSALSHPFESIPRVLHDIAERGDGEGGPLFGQYFSTNSGRLFDKIVMTTDRMRFEYGDLVAIGMLSVDLHGDGVETLLLDRAFSARCSELLREIPVDTTLWQLPRDAVGPQSPAARLWALIQERVKGTKNGFTVLSKLMAAKRPQIFPVWDALVDGLIQRPAGKLWEPMHDLLADDTARLDIETLTNGAPAHVTLLRRIDVALWREARRRAGGREWSV
jgi:hypothetical protein